jgi:DNA replication ATP-dependent helicase Dna2
MDEAGQLSIPLAVAAMVKGTKFIFIGDHKQLPPIISENQEDITFTKSIFEHLFQYAPGLMLDTTYRMNKEINKFPSKQFYEGKLFPEEKNADWILDIPNNFKRHQEILDITKPEVLFCHFHQSLHSRSEYEAGIIAEFIGEYLKNGIKPCDIAIITPFRAQVRQIKKSLACLDNYDGFKDELFVDTIEKIQGQERDIIIYSLATSDPAKAEQRADFFFNPNRFNVALTRAKKKRIVIGNKELFNYESKDYKLNELIKNFRDFYADAYIVEETTKTDDLF